MLYIYRFDLICKFVICPAAYSPASHRVYAPVYLLVIVDQSYNSLSKTTSLPSMYILNVAMLSSMVLVTLM